MGCCSAVREACARHACLQVRSDLRSDKLSGSSSAHDDGAAFANGNEHLSERVKVIITASEARIKKPQHLFRMS
jgi:hypothetical protein